MKEKYQNKQFFFSVLEIFNLNRFDFRSFNQQLLGILEPIVGSFK